MILGFIKHVWGKHNFFFLVLDNEWLEMEFDYHFFLF
jgi:hypothetical protein